MSAGENGRPGERARPASDPATGPGQQQGELAEAVRLLGVARDLGNRIREHLRVEDIVEEAIPAIRDHLNADAAWVFVVNEENKLSRPVAGQYAPLLPETFGESIPPDTIEMLRDRYRLGEIIAVNDIRGPEADSFPPEIREPLIAAGIVSQLLIPFGVADMMLGFMTVERLEYRPWTPAEVHTAELVTADIGRAVHHARLYEREQRLVAELKDVNQAKSDFLAAVSHELRTPLTSIVGYLEMLRDGEAGPLLSAQEKMLASINRNAVRLRSLVEDVLTMSKIEARSFKTVLRPVRLADLVMQAADSARPDAEANGVTLTADRPQRDLLISGDADQLDRALANLLSNAVKFTPAGGQVWVGTAAVPAVPPFREPTAQVTIRDTGIGIPEVDQKRLFEQFFRASNAVKQAIQGTGIGLTIVRSIVANHHGTMDLQSREGEGTTVVIRLPLREPALLREQALGLWYAEAAQGQEGRGRSSR
jgi:two-component system phosphate regulon sensor histidine kinase PhoR